MFLSCSSLTTRLYSLTGVTKKLQAPKNNAEPDLKAILRTIRWVSDLDLRSITLSVDSFNQLESLTDAQNSKELSNECEKAAVGIDHIYCSFIPLLAFEQNAETKLQKMWQKTNDLAQVTGARTFEMLSSPMPIEGTGSRIVGDGFEFAWLNESFSWERIWRKYVSSMRFLSKLAEQDGIKLAIEPRQREIVNGPNLLMQLFADVDSDSLGAIVDVSRLYISKEIPALSIRKLANRIFSVHLSDNDGVTEWHWAPGQGKIDWLPIFKALEIVKYNGILSLDVSGIDVEREIIEGKKFVEGLLASPQIIPKKMRLS
jgi:sugar phosphate isomerase/epimerase